MGYILVIFFVVHWYGSLFFQTFFHHRYAAHGMFKMNRFWEKTFHILSYIFQGSSYLSPFAYGVMHRMHHAFTDTAEDPHSPSYQTNLFKMMWRTKLIYSNINMKKQIIERKFVDGVPKWRSFDMFAQSRISRVLWIIFYVALYIFLAKDNWYWYLLLPFTILMVPIHGAIINWFSHKIGYKNFKMNNTSTNLFPVELLMWGEGLHNNHHKDASNPNFARKWFEFDPTYPFILIFIKFKIIQLK